MVHGASMVHGPSMVHGRPMVHGPSSIHGPSSVHGGGVGGWLGGGVGLADCWPVVGQWLAVLANEWPRFGKHVFVFHDMFA